MNVNITLVLQFFNFALVYTFLRYLIVKPIFLLVQRNRADVLSLEKNIQFLQRKCSSIQQKTVAQWKDCHAFFKDNMPSVVHAEQCKSFQQELEEVEKHAALMQSKEIIKTLSDHIVEKLKEQA